MVQLPAYRAARHLRPTYDRRCRIVATIWTFWSLLCAPVGRLNHGRPEEYLKSSEQEIVWKVFNKENDTQTRRFTIPPAPTSS